MQVKIFFRSYFYSNDAAEKLQADINAWMNEVKATISFVKQSQAVDGTGTNCITISIWYDE